MTAILSSLLPTSDADLVNASRHGDREAFGQIVRRYQGMITGLIYASCGDTQRSEDLAQETFISAWRSLSGLREPGKLTAWLCQIARCRLRDLNRNAAREQIHFKQFVQKRGPDSEAPPADQRTMSNEEREVLWNTLAQIPQPYRETLVLFYRQGKSSADVAAAMEITEEVVRQRLVRGRLMLREQVAAMLEQDLALTAPNSAFTLAVVAALPALATTSVKAATLGAAAKGAGTGIGGSILYAASVAIAPILGAVAFIFGTRANMRAAQSAGERRFVLRAAMVMLLIVLGFIGAMMLLPKAYYAGNGAGPEGLVVQAAMFLAFAVALSVYQLWMNHRRRIVRRSEGLSPAIPSLGAQQIRLKKIFLPLVTFAVLGPVAGIAFQAGNTVWGLVVMGLIVAFSGAIVHLMRTRPPQQIIGLQLLWEFAVMSTLLVIVNWPLRSWIATIASLPLEEVKRRGPLWAIDLVMLAIIVLWASMTVIPLWLRRRNLSQDSAAGAAPQK